MWIIFNVKISQSTVIMVPCCNRMGMVSSLYKALLNLLRMLRGSLSPRPQTNPSADRFQYPACYTGSDIRAEWGLGARLVQNMPVLPLRLGLSSFLIHTHPHVSRTHMRHTSLYCPTSYLSRLKEELIRELVKNSRTMKELNESYLSKIQKLERVRSMHARKVAHMFPVWVSEGLCFQTV